MAAGMSPAALEARVLDAWPARERATLHGWTLLADGGVTGRVNAIVPLAFAGADMDAALDDAVAWQRARATRPCVKIADGAFAPEDLPARLAARGWRPATRTLVMTAPIAEARLRPGTPSAIELTPDYLPEIDAIVRETAHSDAEWAERAGIARRAPAPRRFALLKADGGLAALGLCVVRDGWAGIFLMRTAAPHRRKGLAREILAALLAWSETAGATHAYLQVEADNAPAVALYRSAAFETAYSYSYWRPEAGP